MLFHTSIFWLFFGLVLFSFYLLPRRARPYLLLVASYVFYMWWDWRFAGLILLSTLVDYAVGRRLPSVSERGRKPLLVASLVTNLGILGFFKYYDFFAESFAGLVGLDPGSYVLRIILPVGVSFYTFQSMSYTIDVYRRRIEPVRDFVDFALFVSFFPQLVAGPIVRAKTFFPQLYNWVAPDGYWIRQAIQLVLFGLIKKMVLADRFAAIADGYFANPSATPPGVDSWVGVIAFALQIFYDFSGYTDIARGCALALGFEFPVNFRRPYLATSITDFWHRWHISLSDWLRDYLYIPLGGNRRGQWRTYINLMLTMLLGGLWHGASWTFVAWGAYQGALLALERALSGLAWPAALRRVWGSALLRPLRVALTFFLVCLGWVLFRSPTFTEARDIFGSLFRSGGGEGVPAVDIVHPGLLIAVGLSLLLAVLEERFALLTRLLRAPAAVQVAVYLICLWLLEFFAVVDQSIPYVYFQF